MDNNKNKKYTRREAIKYGAKVGFGAALWGTVGNLLGRGYEAGRDFYRSDVKPVLDKVEKSTNKIGEFADDVNRTFNPWYQPKPEEEKEQPKSTRRGFLKSLAWKAHEHPKTVGTIVGATYGAGKYSLTGLSKYLTNRQIAKLKDENIDYKERLEVLEKYRVGAERDLGGKEDRIMELERNVDELRREIKKQGKLEEKVGESEESKEILLSFGIVGLFVSIGIGSSVITGNIISGITNNNLFPIAAVIFALSLVFILLGIKRKKKL